MTKIVCKTKVVTKEYDYWNFVTKATDIIKTLEALISMHGDSVEFYFETEREPYCDGYNIVCTMKYNEAETDDEARRRVVQTANRKVAAKKAAITRQIKKEEKDRAEFVRLLKKFGKE